MLYSLFPKVHYGFNPSVQSAAVGNRKSYGLVRCGVEKSGFLRCGSVPFPDIPNPLDILPCGSVLRYIFMCGSVLWYILRCSLVLFWKIGKLTVRFGAVLEKRNPTARFGAVPSGSVRLSQFRNPTVKFSAVFRCH